MLENLKVVNSSSCPNIVLSFFTKDIFFGDNFVLDTFKCDLHGLLEKYLSYRDKKYYKVGIFYRDDLFEKAIINLSEGTKTSRRCFSYNSGEDVNVEDILDFEHFFGSLYFIDFQILGREAVLKKYEFLLEDDNLSIYLKDTLNLSNSADFDKNEAGIEEFLSGVCINEKDVLQKFNKLFFERNKDKLGYLDIFSKLISYFSPSGEFLNSLRNRFEQDLSIDNIFCKEYFQFISYFLKDEFFYIVEKFVKEDRIQLIISFNPVFSGKPIPDVKSIRNLSSISKTFLNDSRWSEEEFEKLFLEIEDSPKFGIDGLVICKKYLDTLFKVSEEIKYDWNSPFRICGQISIIQKMYKIVNIFDISVKELWDKTVRAIFYYNLNPDSYLTMCLDYVTMVKNLGLVVPTKFPKEIVEGHNRLKKRQASFQSKELEDKFNKALIFNEGNLTLVPSHKKFTIISPKNSADLINEGLFLNHCVGSYVERFADGYSKVYFVRLKGKEDIPFVTVELDKHDNLVQMSCMNDKNPEEEVWDFVLEWVDNLK